MTRARRNHDAIRSRSGCLARPIGLSRLVREAGGQQALFVLALWAGLGGCAGTKPVADASAAGVRPGDTPQCTDTLLLPTTGLYVVTPLDQPAPLSVLSLPSIEGVVIRVSWRKLQPSAQAPIFRPIDEQLATARRFGKKVALSIEAGIETPDWVYTLGARPYDFILDESAGDRICQRGRIPIPWDPVYLDSFKQLIRTASQRFNRSSLLTHVKLNGLGVLGPAAALPHTAVRSLSNGQKACTTIDEVAAWLDVGYSRQRVMQSWRELIEVYAQSFSSHRLAVTIDTEGFPPIDQRGQLVRGSSYDSDIAVEMIKHALTGREPRVLLQSNGLTNNSPYPFPIRFGEEVSIGYQFRYAVSGDKTFRMNGGTQESVVAIFDGTVRRGVAARARYLEVQAQDAEDPQLAASLSGARILLRRMGR